MGAHVQSWFISLLLHGTVALASVLFVRYIQLAPQDEPFKWNVAMVSPTQPVQPRASPPNRVPAPPVPPTTSIPSPPVQQTAPAQPPPKGQSLAQTTPFISGPTAKPVITEPPALTQPQPMSPSQSGAYTTQPTEPIRHEIVTPMAAAVETEGQMEPSNAASAILEQVTQSDETQAPRQMAAVSPTPTNAPTTRDYGWLSEEILRRVEELKRYPPSARMDRAEGKVVVRAVINEDGTISDVEVIQSSGHPGLDKAAVETVQQAAPFHLPHPLGQPHKTIKIPMSYRLDR